MQVHQEVCQFQLDQLHRVNQVHCGLPLEVPILVLVGHFQFKLEMLISQVEEILQSLVVLEKQAVKYKSQLDQVQPVVIWPWFLELVPFQILVVRQLTLLLALEEVVV